MEKWRVFLAAALLAGAIAGCSDGVSTEALTKEVRASIEKTWAAEPALASAKIKEFSLVHKEGQQYRGLLEAEQNGEAITVALDVTFDGKAFIWEIEQ